MILSIETENGFVKIQTFMRKHSKNYILKEVTLRKQNQLIKTHSYVLNDEIPKLFLYDQEQGMNMNCPHLYST
jgi:hypothetical protein